jgi:hypothetical protein
VAVSVTAAVLVTSTPPSILETSTAAAVLEATAAAAASAPVVPETAAVESAAAASAAALFVVVVLGVVGESGGNEDAEGLALQECAKFLFEVAAREERFLSLPRGGVHAQHVVHEAHQLVDPQRVVLQLR